MKSYFYYAELYPQKDSNVISFTGTINFPEEIEFNCQTVIEYIVRSNKENIKPGTYLVLKSVSRV